MENEDVFDIPDRFIDRTTGLIMHDPVITVTGHTWERFSISQWLSSQGTCPDTREEIAEFLLYPNVDLRSEIRDFVDKFWNKISLDEYSNPEWLQDLKYKKMGLGSLEDVIRVFNEELPKLLDAQEGDEHTGDWVIHISAAASTFRLQEEERNRLLSRYLLYFKSTTIPLTILFSPTISVPLWLYYMYESERQQELRYLPAWVFNEDDFPVNSLERNALWKRLGVAYGLAFMHSVFFHHLIAHYFIDNTIFEKILAGNLSELYDEMNETQQWVWSAFYTCFALLIAFGSIPFFQETASVTHPVRWVNGATLPSQHTPTITEINNLDALEAGTSITGSAQPTRRMTDEDAANITYRGTLPPFFEDDEPVESPISWARQAYYLTRGFVNYAITPNPEDRGWRPIGRLFNPFAP